MNGEAPPKKKSKKDKKKLRMSMACLEEVKTAVEEEEVAEEQHVSELISFFKYNPIDKFSSVQRNTFKLLFITSVFEIERWAACERAGTDECEW